MEKEWFVNEETKNEFIEKHRGANNINAVSVYWDGQLFPTMKELSNYIKMTYVNFWYHIKKGHFVLIPKTETSKYGNPVQELKIIKGTVTDYQPQPLKEIKDGKYLCGTCNQWKPTNEFPTNPKKRLGYADMCRGCHSKYYTRKTVDKQIIDGKQQCGHCKEWKPVDRFSPSKQTRTGLSSLCKECRASYRETNTDKLRDVRLKRMYGITESYYQELLKQQNGKCAICGKPESENRNKKLHIDHDHETGKVRALLCNNCNRGLGLLGDSKENLMALVSYLDKFQPTNPPSKVL